MREPFYWPMNAPPLPQPYPANEVGKDWELLHQVEAIRNKLRQNLGLFNQQLEMDPAEVEETAHHEYVRGVFRSIAKRDKALLDRLADM